MSCMVVWSSVFCRWVFSIQFLAAPWMVYADSPLPLRNAEIFLDPVFVPDFFFDLAGSGVLDALTAVRPDGHRYTGSILDEMVPKGPQMAPVLLWHCGLWKSLSLNKVSQVIVDVGAHEWRSFLPELRVDPNAWLILVESGRTAFLELYRRLKVDYSDVLDRVVALPVALTREPGLQWGFQSVRTDLLGGEWPEIVVPVTSFDVVLRGLMLGTSTVPEAKLAEFKGALRQGPPIKLKLDGHAADVDILSALATESSPLAAALLDRIEEIQIEVSEAVTRARRETITRMNQLGYQLDWQREEVEDGGTHPVVFGCRLVSEVPRTEDCFFRRSSSWAHGRVLDHILRRPEEVLRISEGSELSISSQFSYYMNVHIQECQRDEELAQLSAQIGSGLGCLYCLAGEPLRQVFHSIMELWEVMWSIKREMDQKTILGHYTRVLEVMWPVLDSLPDGWEQLHDVGVGHLVFVVLVEATCLAFPAACPTECQDVGQTPRLAGRPSPCVTLGNCFDLFKGTKVTDILENPEKNVRIFRAAERLTAPLCFPASWHLELDRDRSPHFPTTVTEDGEYNVTALEVDSADCFVEISLVAWDVDGRQMLQYHRKVWELREESYMENIKAHHSSDFRVPTEGKLWDFDCLFRAAGSGNDDTDIDTFDTFRTRGDVFSASMLAELPGTKEPPMLFVRCEAPSQWAQRPERSDGSGSGGSGGSGPSEVVLTRAGRASLDMPNIELSIPLRQMIRQRPKTAMCTQQVWDFQGLENLVPKHAEFWFRYHIDFFGIDEIYLYDLDGSFKDLSIVQELQKRGKLFYENFITSVPPLKEVYALAGYKTWTTHLAQTLVQQHCWQRARQNADWVISVSHGWDMFIFSPSMGTIKDLLQELEPDEVTYVLGVRYGSKDAREADTTNVFTRFPYHNDPSIRPENFGSPEEQIVIANPRLVDSAVLGEVVVRQQAPLRSNLLELNELNSCSEAEFVAPSMRKRRLDPWKWRANHYVSLLGRSVVFASEESTPELRDFSIYDAAAVALGHQLNGFG